MQPENDPSLGVFRRRCWLICLAIFTSICRHNTSGAILHLLLTRCRRRLRRGIGAIGRGAGCCGLGPRAFRARLGRAAFGGRVGWCLCRRIASGGRLRSAFGGRGSGALGGGALCGGGVCSSFCGSFTWQGMIFKFDFWRVCYFYVIYL